MVSSHVNPAPRKYSQLPRFFRWFSDHCVLRQIDESDVARLVRAGSQNGASQCATVAMPQTHIEALELVQAAQSHWMRGTRYTLAVLRKQTHDFVGWIELTPVSSERGAWMLDVFVHPQFAAAAIAIETITATADLMFSALSATRLYATCPRACTRVETLLNEAGFIELIPAGAVDQSSGKARPRSLHELGHRDWIAMRRAQTESAGQESVTYVSNWVSSGMREDLALL
jgi:RimJ/RimL family protein N-acetyltransferase